MFRTGPVIAVMDISLCQVLSPPPPVNHSNFPSVGSAEHETRFAEKNVEIHQL